MTHFPSSRPLKKCTYIRQITHKPTISLLMISSNDIWKIMPSIYFIEEKECLAETFLAGTEEIRSHSTSHDTDIHLAPTLPHFYVIVLRKNVFRFLRTIKI